MEELLNKSVHCHQLLKAGDVYYLVEDKDVLKFVKSNDKWNLKVNTKNTLDFYQIDKCVINDNKYQRVDWMILNKKDIYLIEVKDRKDLNKGRKEAKEKLKGTLKYFNDNGCSIDTDNTTYILNIYRAKRNIAGTIRNTTNKKLREEYKVDFGVNYEEGNSIYIN